MQRDESESMVCAYQHRLPHWRLKDAIYFITWRLGKGLDELRPEERDLVAGAIFHFDNVRYKLFAFVVMNDHVHLIVQPFQGQHLENIIHSVKSFTANQLQRRFQRTGKVWQPEYFDRIIRNQKEFAGATQYILLNPWKRWPALEKYEWVWTLMTDEW